MLKINICVGSSCHLKGAYDVLREFQSVASETSAGEYVDMGGRFCMGKCQEGVSISIEDEYFSVSPSTAREFFKNVVIGKISGQEASGGGFQ
jgi:NADH:ubiquinone oxidoreductase subunit E